MFWCTSLQYRQQDCLNSDILGPARAAETTKICGIEIPEGAIIIPPKNAASVSIENICIGNVIITEKKPSQFRNGFWDITIKYSFNYRLVFREADGCFIDAVNAVSIFTKKVSLFGSNDTCVQIVTDLLDSGISSGPHILVEAKAVSLTAEIDFCSRNCCERAEPVGVNVTIGLFTIIKLYRIVNLKVESRGFCIPDECEETSPINVCDFFDGLDFPMDLFAPPQKPEFFAGISNDIPRVESERDECRNRGDNSGCGNSDCDRNSDRNCDRNSDRSSNCGCGCGNSRSAGANFNGCSCN